MTDEGHKSSCERQNEDHMQQSHSWATLGCSGGGGDHCCVNPRPDQRGVKSEGVESFLTSVLPAGRASNTFLHADVAGVTGAQPMGPTEFLPVLGMVQKPGPCQWANYELLCMAGAMQRAPSTSNIAWSMAQAGYYLCAACSQHVCMDIFFFSIALPHGAGRTAMMKAGKRSEGTVRDGVA